MVIIAHRKILIDLCVFYEWDLTSRTIAGWDDTGKALVMEGVSHYMIMWNPLNKN